jgi:intein-encoded DNA endonuclease-like protein
MGRYLPRELRIKLYGDVVALRRGGLTYRGIIEEVWRRYGVRISKSSISEWLRGMHSPYNGRRIPSLELLEPSEELAYVIGVKVGDGYTYRVRSVRKGYNYVWIGLKARDREFVEGFGRCLAKVLGSRQIRPRYVKSSGRYVVEAESKTLYELLRKPVNLDRLRRYIEHCERCVSAFLRGFAYSEGNVDKSGYIYIYNTDLRLLTYIMDLLRRFNIESTGPRISVQRRTVFYGPRAGKKYAHKKNVRTIYIRARSNINFYRYAVFTITKKQIRLENYVERTTRMPTPPPNHFPANTPTLILSIN